MSLVKRLLPLGRDKDQNVKTPFLEDFYQSDKRSDHPYRMALHTYNQLCETTESREEVFLFMVEDIIFSSLYATFYEQVLYTSKENPKLAVALIRNFEQDHEEREQLIAAQTALHFNYVLEGGNCKGCVACDNHGDVAELVSYFQNGNFNFFKNLYIGMQTIQFAMEELIYDLTPDNLDWLKFYSPENILEFRQKIIEYADNKNAC